MEKKERLTPPDVTDVSLLKLPRKQFDLSLTIILEPDVITSVNLLTC